MSLLIYVKSRFLFSAPFFPPQIMRASQKYSFLYILISTQFPLVTVCALFSAPMNIGVFSLSLAWASSPKTGDVFDRIHITYLLSVPCPAACRAFPLRILFLPPWACLISSSRALVRFPLHLRHRLLSRKSLLVFSLPRIGSCIAVFSSPATVPGFTSYLPYPTFPSIFLAGLRKHCFTHKLSLLSPCILVTSTPEAPAATGNSLPTSCKFPSFQLTDSHYLRTWPGASFFLLVLGSHNFLYSCTSCYCQRGSIECMWAELISWNKWENYLSFIQTCQCVETNLMCCPKHHCVSLVADAAWILSLLMWHQLNNDKAARKPIITESKHTYVALFLRSLLVCLERAWQSCSVFKRGIKCNK